nr:NLR family CARD domain-containing protein 3-like isoform X2 [Misgurnus anguillicaudatus]
MSLYRKMKDGDTAAFPEPSCVSMKSENSLHHPPGFSNEAMTPDPRQLYTEPNLLNESEDLHQDSHKPVDDVLQRVKDQHKTIMKNKYESLFEGIKQQENQTLLKRIYTQLYIIEGESEGVNEEHEILHMEKNTRTQHLQDTTLYCNDIFIPLPEPEHKTKKRKDKIKSVLTKGIAGIGKTVSVQKFILDWAEGTANQDVDFMFVLPFRELNLIQDDQYSLHKLLLDFHPELQDLDPKIYDECKIVFIFDGLDENRMTLMFSDAEKVSDGTETSSVPVLISNLMKGDLLPSALIWITSRPAAANQIPSKYIHRLTEIQGFNDAQKEEYLRKSISDEHQASRIISHIKRSRSLHIMCHIPVFCWISSTVLQNILKQDNERAEIPKTLTEMYIHFLLIQMNMKNEKYDERDPEKLLQSNREMIVKLSKLAFEQLMKGNVMFYEEEVRESGIDITDASVYSGICTEIFKGESGIHQRKIYCFIHLSFQEFLAALYLFYCSLMKNTKSLQIFLKEKYDLYSRFSYNNNYKSGEIALYYLLQAAVDIALQSKNGHLDLFQRFLLGISLKTNQRLLQDLLTHTVDTSETMKDIKKHIKNKVKHNDHLSVERSINLFLCLLEVNDQTLYREIKEFVRSDKQSEKKLSAAYCSALAYMLQMSEEVLDEFDLKEYNTTQEGRRRLILVVSNCTKANLQSCDLTALCCESLSLCLQSSNSAVRDLDLSFNDLQDSGVKLISDALKSPDCKLEILRLSGCMVTDEGCCYLASALSSNPSSHLRELDLSYNHPQHSGVQMLSQRLCDPNSTLNKLNLDHGGEFRITAGLYKYACDLTLDPNTANTQLILSEDNRKVTCMNVEQSYPDHPERFRWYPQVFCKESLTGRCYWEVKWSGWGVFISVANKSIHRKDRRDDSLFGFNKKSWSLQCTNRGITARHRSKGRIISALKPYFNNEAVSNRVGVYLDWSAGTLSFYSVTDTQTLTHLHTFNTTFTQPLYAGFMVYLNSSVSLSG